MIGKVVLWGSSVVVRLDKKDVKAEGLKPGQNVFVEPVRFYRVSDRKVVE